MKRKIIGLVLLFSLLFSTLQPAVSQAAYADLIMGKHVFNEKVKYLTERVISSQKTDIVVGQIKEVKDFAGNRYTLVECEPTGYFILHNASGQYMEYTMESDSPYLNVSGELYYGGPMQYYVRKEGTYIHTITFTEFTESDEFLDSLREESSHIHSSILTCKNEKVVAFLNDASISSGFENLTDVNMPQAKTGTNYWVTSHSYIKDTLKYTFGYYCPKGSNGICGYIAANIILLYWNFRGEITLPGEYSSTREISNAKLTLALHQTGKDMGYGDGTWAQPMVNILNKFCKKNALPQNANWAVGCTGITTQIRKYKRPCILFGNLPNAGNHAVVAYGYNTYENTWYDTFVCHYGYWGKSAIHIYGGIYGSNLRYCP